MVAHAERKPLAFPPAAFVCSSTFADYRFVAGAAGAGAVGAAGVAGRLVDEPTVVLVDELLAVLGPCHGAHKTTIISTATTAIMPNNVLPLIPPGRSRVVRRPKSSSRITYLPSKLAQN
jgi:hypothetical protein